MNRGDEFDEFFEIYTRMKVSGSVKYLDAMMYALYLVFKDNSGNPTMKGVENPSKVIIQEKRHVQEKKPLIIDTKVVDTQNQPCNLFQEYQLWQQSKKYISERDMVIDLFYCFQGIDGKYIVYDKRKQNFQFNDKINVQSNFGGLIQQHCELGLLVREIKIFSELNITASSLILQSFCNFLKSELSTFYKLVSVLEAQNQSNPLTMKRISVWIIDPLERMQILSSMIKATADLKGGQFISKIYEFSLTGDGIKKGFAVEVIKTVCKPLYGMIYKWICFGEIMDPYSEFFIVCNTKKNCDLWREKYSVNESMIPSGISKKLALDILLVGKSINFVIQNCSQMSWSMSAEILKLPCDNARAVSTIVSLAMGYVNQAILSLLFDKFALMQHLELLHEVLLLGNGHFVQSLTEGLGIHLIKPSTQIQRNFVIEAFDQALKTLQIRDDKLERSVTSKFDPKTGVLGWDAFSMGYTCVKPLDTILSTSDSAEYEQIFRFLWNIKRIESLLVSSWKNNMGNENTKTNTLAHLVRNEVSHFLTNLQYFLFFDILTESSSEFFSQMKEIKDNNGNLDDLLELHSKYRKNLTKDLLVDISEPIKANLSQILKAIVSFIDQIAIIAHDSTEKIEIHQQSITKIRNEFLLNVKLLIHKFDENKSDKFQKLKFRLDYTTFYSK